MTNNYFHIINGIGVKRNGIFMLFLIVFIALASCQQQPYQMKTVRTSGGWGYQIFDHNKLFIDQETIPAIAGDKAFPSEAQAQKVGKLVLKKLENGQLPSVSSDEVRQLMQ